MSRKTCVFIIGTNGVGKTALARALIEHYGGVECIYNDVTYCSDGVVCFAGNYVKTRFGGVDSLGCTTGLAEIVEVGLKERDVIICEGKFLKSFSLSMTNAMFKAESFLVVFLHADSGTIKNRIICRSGGDKERRWDLIMRDQKQTLSTVKKWKSIGVNTLVLDTACMTIEQEVIKVCDEIERLTKQ